MTLFERHYRLRDQFVRNDQLDFPFVHLLDHATLPEKWLTAIQRAELALAEHLP
ncbi:hypothetical protein HBB04_01360 [Pseudomonas coronafaciens]|nr:hypothetical protein HBB04_01360 [Pseudomonas coronafaciens]